MNSSFRSVVVALASLVVSCGPGDDGEPNVDEGPITIRQVQTEVFTPSCVFASCHGADGRKGGLVLEAEEARSNLVNVPVANRAGSEIGLVRVTPGDVDGSFLVTKMRGPQDPMFGDAMPQGSDGAESEQVDLVVEWIESGAE